MVSIQPDVVLAIRQHAERDYPNECCGILIASSNSPNIISRSHPMTNVHETPHNRYSVDPFELMRLEDELDESTELMVGIYHSHPDHPARPSSFDLKYAWPNLLYAVIGVQHGVVEKITVWKLGDKEFAEIMIDES